MKHFIYFVLLILSNSVLFGQTCKFEKYYPYYPSVMGSTRAIVLKDGGFLMAVPAMDDTLDYEFFYPTLVLVRTDACGKTIWVNKIGNPGTGHDDLSLHELSDGTILVVGNTPSGNPGATISIRLAKHNGVTGALLKEVFVKGTPSSRYVGCIPNSYKPGTYIVFGNTKDYPFSGDKTRPLLVEIDEELNVKRWKQYQYSDFTTETVTVGAVFNIFIKDASTYYSFMHCGNSSGPEYSYLLTLDTAFSIINKIQIPTDSISYGLYSNYDPRWDSVNQIFVGYGSLNVKGGFGSTGLLKIGIDGLLKSSKLIEYPSIDDCMPTTDGGYIAVSTTVNSDDGQLEKLDSNFNTVWTKQTHGRLATILQTQDGSYVAAGVSLYRFLPRAIGQLYLVRADSDGTFFYSGISEQMNEQNSINVYPNPSTGIFTFEGLPSAKTKAPVWDATGKLVYTGELENTILDLSNQPQGLYVVHITNVSGKVVAVKKLSVLR